MFHRLPETLRSFACALVALVALACTPDDPANGESPCEADEERNPISGECKPQVRTRPDDDTGSDPTDASPTDAETSERDTGGPSNDTSRADTRDCDRDNDQSRDERCGGPDCNADNPAIRPGAAELCDQKDNDCDGEVDEEVDCTFFAHGTSTLYRVNPFDGSVSPQNASNAPSRDFLDIDTHPDGDLYAITAEALYRLPEGANTWQRATSLRGIRSSFNGMAIDRRGTGYLTGFDTLYRLDLTDTSGSPSPTTVGQFGGDYRSSGDCVINKKGTLLMTSSNDIGENDTLVEVNQSTGRATEVGRTNHDEIWGLTAAWSKLYGTTSGGELIVIDPDDGSSRTLQSFSGPSFYGAASTPASRRRAD